MSHFVADFFHVPQYPQVPSRLTREIHLSFHHHRYSVSSFSSSPHCFSPSSKVHGEEHRCFWTPPEWWAPQGSLKAPACGILRLSLSLHHGNLAPCSGFAGSSTVRYLLLPRDVPDWFFILSSSPSRGLCFWLVPGNFQQYWWNPGTGLTNRAAFSCVEPRTQCPPSGFQAHWVVTSASMIPRQDNLQF